MKLSLRELFLAPEALDPGNSPLVRLAALQHLHRTMGREDVRGKLESLLAGQESRPSVDAAANLFPLQVAVVLAQDGGVAGIEWLVRFLTACDARQERLGFTALRNCRQFPLAVLLACTTTARSIETSYGQLGGLSAFSDDQAWNLATKGSPSDCAATVTALEFGLRQVQNGLRADRKLALGAVLTRPFLKPLTGIRYTGFAVIEDGPARWRAIPYQMASIINPDDGSARVTGADLLKTPGKRVVVAYATDKHNEAKAVYALPFAPTYDIAKLLPQIALRCEGLSIAVVVDKWDSRGKERYRFITGSGLTESDVDYSGRVKVGECALIHASTSRPFFTHLQLGKSDVEKVVQEFVRTTQLERAVLLKSWKNGYALGGQSGRMMVLHDQVPTEPVVLLQAKVVKDENRTFTVRLPFPVWTPRDRTDVLQRFFENSSDNYAVVVGVLDGERGARAVIVNPESGEHKFWTTELRATGMPVYWEVGDNDAIYPTILDDQLVTAKCSACFDTNYRICPTCGGRGRATCSQCGGSKKSECGHCNGSGERRFDCRPCSGTGQCGNCGGSGTVTLNCKICEGTGRYADSGRHCKKCSGAGTFSVPCRVCAGSGQCRKCQGSGDEFRDCRSCDATGRWNCDRCHATGIGPCDNCEGTSVSVCGCGGIERIRLRPAQERV